MTRRTLNNGIVSKRLIELRTLEGLTQKELSENTGISLNSIKNYEGERRIPDRTNLTILANYFNVDETWITGESEHKNMYEKFISNVGIDKIQFLEYATNNNIIWFDLQEDFEVDVDSITHEEIKNLHDNIITLVKKHLM